MRTYKLQKWPNFCQRDDGVLVGWDTQEYIDFSASGGTPLPVDQPTQDQLFAAIESAIQRKINEVAQQDGWDNQTTCMARAGYANPWQAKALAYSTWVDNCWLHTLTEKAKIIAGTRTNIPTPAEAVLELPVMVWPI